MIIKLHPNRLKLIAQVTGSLLSKLAVVGMVSIPALAAAAEVLDYSVERSVDGRYHVYMRPTTAPTPNLNLTGQVTLTVPTGTGATQFLPTDIQSAVSGVTWTLSSRTNAPTENTSADYLSFTFSEVGNTAFNWSANTPLEVFSFTNNNNCVGSVGIMADTDPFNVVPNSANSNIRNQFTNLGWGTASDNNFLGIYGTAVSCNHAPTITSNGAGGSASLSIPEETTTSVTTVTATDIDTNTLTFSISGGVDASRFTINPSTGVLTFTSMPHYAAPTDSNKDNVYNVQVTVNDGQGGTDVQDLAITITNTTVNSTCPMPVVNAANGSTFNWPGTPSVVSVTTNTAWSNTAVNSTAYNIAGENRPLMGTKRWDRSGDMNLTLNFAPAIPANELVFAILDVGGGTPDPYDPTYTFSVNGGTGINDFTMRVIDNVSSLIFTNTSTIKKDTLTGHREAGALIGTTTTLVSSLTLTSSSVKSDDFVAYAVGMRGACEFGDAPDNPGTGPAAGDYRTLFASGAPVHAVSPNPAGITRFLGAGLTTEPNGLPNATATGDTDDGVTIPALRQVRDDTVSVVVAGTGYLQGWMDWNNNGIFDAAEQIATDVQDNGAGDTDATVGTIKLTVNPPNTSVVGNTFARFRWSSQTGLSATSIAADGEIEDYQVNIQLANAIPVITSNSGGATATLDLREDTFTTVTTVTATDGDATDTLTYSISGGTDAADFTIDPVTGVLTFASTPHFATPQDSDTNNSYEVIVQVSDGQGGIDTQTLTINILPGYLKLQVRGFLQGAFNSTTSLMRDTLRTKTLIPTTQPYGTLLSYTGTETLDPALLTTTGNNAIIDWVMVEFRDAATPHVTPYRFAAVIQSDGDVVNPTTGSNTFDINAIPDGNYFISLRHRNHLGVTTAAPIAFDYVSTKLVDFTLPATLTMGTDAQISSGTVNLMWVGDINQDDSAIANGPDNDLSNLLGGVITASNNPKYNTNYMYSGYRSSDLNMDGFSIFAGPNNDTNILIGNVLMHPVNTTYSSNYVVRGTIPKAPQN